MRNYKQVKYAADVLEIVDDCTKSNVQYITISDVTDGFIDILASFESCGCKICGTVRVDEKNAIKIEIPLAN